MQIPLIALAFIFGGAPMPAPVEQPTIEATGYDHLTLHFEIQGPEHVPFVLEQSRDLIRWTELYPLVIPEDGHTNAVHRLYYPQLFLRVTEDVPDALPSIAGYQFSVKVSEGKLPLATTGQYRLFTRSEGVFFLQSLSNPVRSSAGVYTYRKLSDESGEFDFHDQVAGLRGIGLLTFQSRYRGNILLIQNDGPGYQYGTFQMSLEE